MKPPHADRWFYASAKRCLDLAVAVGALPFALLISLPCACLIGARAPGPILLRQPREGLEGRMFGMWKLRTMYVDADDRLVRYLEQHQEARLHWERDMCLPRDPRVAAPVAEFCRRYAIDELPQLLNVLAGDMTLVGPRPLTPADARRLFDEDTRLARLQVRPGLTGLWQATRTSKKDVTVNMGRQDLAYLRQRSFRLDLWICWRTIRAVLSGGGQY